jgi:predicted AAA+ superfamily ATPase
MVYKKRYLEAKVRAAAKIFKVVLVLGARQVGKSTLLRHLFPEMKLFLFDSILDIHNVKTDPDLFLDLHQAPLILDEAQFAPALLSAIKRRVESTEEKGRYFLTGSQNLTVLKTVGETMTGRVGVMQMEGLSLLERQGFGDQDSWLKRYLDDPWRFIQEPSKTIGGLPPVHHVVWKGSFPQIFDIADEDVSLYFNSYIQTYVERDLRLLERVDDLNRFGAFLGLLGALSGREINYTQLGREINITPQTAKRWLFTLSALYQWRDILPLHRNSIKKISEKRKGVLTDSGVACHLLRIKSPEDLATHPSLGALFETWVINHLYQLFTACSMIPFVYHFRTHGGAEIDLVLELNGIYFPIEIKCSRNLSSYDLRSFKSLQESFPDRKIAPGLIIYAGDESYLLDKNTLALSWKAF